MDYSGRNIEQIIDGEDFNYKMIVKFLHGNKGYFEQFVNYSLTNNKHAWRCSWILYHYISEYGKAEIQKYAGEYIASISNITKDGQIRENLKILLKLDLTENQTGDLYDFCLNILWDNKKQSSVRSVAFQFLLTVADNYPELKNEIFEIFDQIKDHLSEGIKRSMINKK